MEGSLLTRLFIKHNDKNLKRYVMSFCWRSVNTLMRSCKALHALIQPLLRDSSFMQVIVYSELSAITRPLGWPQTVAIQAAFTFDPFFDCWPLDMPARPPASTGQMLSWLWARDLIKLEHFNHFNSSLNQKALFKLRDCKRFHVWTWEFRFDPGLHITGFGLLHEWTAYRTDFEGDHWYRGNMTPWHQCIMEVGKRPIFNFLRDEVLWTHGGNLKWKPRPGYYLHGWLIAFEPLEGAHEWIKE
jgi:hypothetical protein